MPCTPIDFGNGVTGIVCTRGSRARCGECGNHAPYLCDWKLKGKKAGKTCDRKLCGSCATSPAKDKHLCPAHSRMWEAMKAEGATR